MTHSIQPLRLVAEPHSSPIALWLHPNCPEAVSRTRRFQESSGWYSIGVLLDWVLQPTLATEGRIAKPQCSRTARKLPVEMSATGGDLSMWQNLWEMIAIKTSRRWWNCPLEFIEWCHPCAEVAEPNRSETAPEPPVETVQTESTCQVI